MNFRASIPISRLFLGVPIFILLLEELLVAGCLHDAYQEGFGPASSVQGSGEKPASFCPHTSHRWRLPGLFISLVSVLHTVSFMAVET